MKKYVSSLEMADEIGRIVEHMDICLYLNKLHENYGKSFRDERSLCSFASVSEYISDRLYDSLNDLRVVVDECEVINDFEDDVRLKVS